MNGRRAHAWRGEEEIEGGEAEGEGKRGKSNERGRAPGENVSPKWGEGGGGSPRRDRTRPLLALCAL